MHTHPADISIQECNAEPFIKLASLSRFVELAEDMRTVLRVDHFFIRRRAFHQALARPSGDLFIGFVDIESLLCQASVELPGGHRACSVLHRAEV